jgi:hypothetical protein
MAAADLVAPALPGALTPSISLGMMGVGMAAGTLAARLIAARVAIWPDWTESRKRGEGWY